MEPESFWEKWKVENAGKYKECKTQKAKVSLRYQVDAQFRAHKLQRYKDNKAEILKQHKHTREFQHALARIGRCHMEGGDTTELVKQFKIDFAQPET